MLVFKKEGKVLVVSFLIEISNGYFLIGVVPESLALLLFGVGLVGVTVALRKFLKRRDQKIDGK